MNINLITPVCDTSYGIVGLHVLKELSKHHNVSLFNIGQISGSDAISNQDIIRQALNNAKLFNHNAPCVKIWHQFDMIGFTGGKKIAFPFFELDTLTEIEKHHLSYCDHICVASEWAKNILYKNGIEKEISVVPLGYDPEIFKPVIKDNNSDTIFLVVGKLEKRKLHDEIVEGFNIAFDYKDSAQLWMACENIFLTPEQNEAWKNKYRNTKLGQKIRFIPRVDNQTSLARIMNMADVIVNPSRGEAWNMPVLEGMACSREIITTNYSGMTQYTKQGVALIDIDELEIAKDDVWFHGEGGKWAKFGQSQMDQLVNYLQYFHEQKSSGKSLVNKTVAEVASKFTWANTANKLLEVLR
jgi:glycosyltransferase involved in cell wall biosynthesis